MGHLVGQKDKERMPGHVGRTAEGPPGSPGGSGDRGVGSERGDFCEHGSWTEEAREEAGLGRRKRPCALQDERGPLLKDSSR